MQDGKGTKKVQLVAIGTLELVKKVMKAYANQISGNTKMH